MVKEKEEKYVMGSVATQTQPMVIDTSKEEDSEERVMPVEAALTKILNELEEIKKAVLG